jgi:hypothetical protein
MTSWKIKWSWEEAIVINLVIRRPKVKQRIQKELDDAKRKGLLSCPFPTYDECVALPYLQATAIGSISFHPSIGTVLERVVLRGGRISKDSTCRPGRRSAAIPWSSTETKRCTDPISEVSILIDSQRQRGEEEKNRVRQYAVGWRHQEVS